MHVRVRAHPALLTPRQNLLELDGQFARGLGNLEHLAHGPDLKTFGNLNINFAQRRSNLCFAVNVYAKVLTKVLEQDVGAVPANLKAEFSKTAKHLRGTLSMARGGHDVDSAGSQFFICVADKTHLDGQYSIFGTTVLGMDVADRIVHGQKRSGAGQGAPVHPVVILKVEILEGTDGLTGEEAAAWEALPADRKSVK